MNLQRASQQAMATALWLLLTQNFANAQANPNPNASGDDCHGRICTKEAIIGASVLFAIGLMILLLIKCNDKVPCCNKLSQFFSRSDNDGLHQAINDGATVEIDDNQSTNSGDSSNSMPVLSPTAAASS